MEDVSDHRMSELLIMTHVCQTHWVMWMGWQEAEGSAAILPKRAQAHHAGLDPGQCKQAA